MVSGVGSLVEEENVTPTGSDEEVLMIAVEKVGKELLAQVPFRVSGFTQVIVCQLDTAAHAIFCHCQTTGSWEAC